MRLTAKIIYELVLGHKELRLFRDALTIFPTSTAIDNITNFVKDGEQLFMISISQRKSINDIKRALKLSNMNELFADFEHRMLLARKSALSGLTQIEETKEGEQ